MFYAVFFVFYNVALGYTTVARGTLALSTLPLMTMVAGAVLGIEALSARKTTGVLVAMLGVGVALASGLAHAPAGAWRGDLIMAAATLCMALYNVFSRPYIGRSSALGFLTMGMAVGGGVLVVISVLSGGVGADRQVRARRGDRRALSRRRRRRARLLPVGVRPAARQPDPRRQHHGGQPAGGRAAGGASCSTSRSRSISSVGLAAVFAGIWIATTERAAAVRG